VNPEEAGATFGRQSAGRSGHAIAILNRQAADRPQESLAGRADQDWSPQRLK
jgi:hypothetical protein